MRTEGVVAAIEDIDHISVDVFLQRNDLFTAYPLDDIQQHRISVYRRDDR
jgi:hypothetical protein